MVGYVHMWTAVVPQMDARDDDVATWVTLSKLGI